MCCKDCGVYAKEHRVVLLPRGLMSPQVRVECQCEKCTNVWIWFAPLHEDGYMHEETFDPLDTLDA